MEISKTRKYRIKDEDIRDNLRVRPIKDRMIENSLRWFGMYIGDQNMH